MQIIANTPILYRYDDFRQWWNIEQTFLEGQINVRKLP